MSGEHLEFRLLSPEWERSLACFFQDLQAGGDARHFHPHPFTAEAAQKLCHYDGKDLYYVAVEGQCILGYGMLRGWDEGYAVPSLGIAIHASARGTGLARSFMHFLHAAARRRGAPRVRLKVYPENTTAVGLYRSLGYQFADDPSGQLLGVLDLSSV